jgi:hypothetical protein
MCGLKLAAIEIFRFERVLNVKNLPVRMILTGR